MSNGTMNFSIGEANKTYQQIMPLRILIVGNFNGESDTNIVMNSAQNDITPHPAPAPQSVDKYTLDTYLRSLNINLYFETQQFFTTASGKQFFQFSPRSLNDFTPKGLLEIIPDLKRLHTLRTQIKNFPPGALSEEQISGLVQAYGDIEPLQAIFTSFSKATRAPVKPAPTSPAAGASAQDDNAVSRLLDMVGTPDQDVTTNNANTPSHTSEHATEDTLISQLVTSLSISSSKPKQDQVLRKTALQYIDAIVQTQLNNLLHDEQFQTIESLWRGLKFLVDRTNFRKAIDIQCLSTSRDKLVADLIHNTKEEEPYTLVLSTFYVNNTSSELNELQTLTEHAESMQTPFIFALNNHFLNTEINATRHITSNPVTWMQQPQYQQWNALRKKSSARWGTALYNRFLLRDAYDPEMRQSSGVEENITCIDESLWGNPGFALLTLITRSFERTDWPTEIQGNINGELDDLCLRHVSPASAKAFSTPLETRLSNEQIQDLSATGIAALTGSLNDDRAYIYETPCLWENAKYSDERYTTLSDSMNNLAYQLLIARLAHTVSRQIIHLRQLSNTSVLTEEITQLVTGLLATSGHGTKISVTVDIEDGTQQRVAFIRARTGQKLLNGADIEFGLAI